MNIKGFYALSEQNSDIIWEVFENTDENWLEDCPEHTHLVDEWLYLRNDEYNNRIYGTGGSILALQTVGVDLKTLHKIEGKEYKVFGSGGTLLKEVDPEANLEIQLEKYKKENEELKKTRSILDNSPRMNMFETLDIVQDNKRLKEANKLLVNQLQEILDYHLNVSEKEWNPLTIDVFKAMFMHSRRLLTSLQEDTIDS